METKSCDLCACATFTVYLGIDLEQAEAHSEKRIAAFVHSFVTTIETHETRRWECDLPPRGSHAEACGFYGCISMVIA
jgi:hypothetical protein